MPTLVFFLAPKKPLQSYGYWILDTDRQARTRNTVLVKSRETTIRSQTLPRWLGGRRGKDDIKLNELVPMLPVFRLGTWKYKYKWWPFRYS